MAANEMPGQAPASWGVGAQRAAWMYNVDLNTQNITAALGVPRVARKAGSQRWKVVNRGAEWAHVSPGAYAQTADAHSGTMGLTLPTRPPATRAQV
jgi:hypothetical protein